MTSVVVFAMFIASAVWLSLIVLAPMMAPTGTLLDLSGTVGVRENDDQFEDLDPLVRAVYVFGDIECHQLAERSYFLNGNQMPFCARDLGLFAGLAAGFAFASFVAMNVNPLLFLLGLVPMGLDGGVQLVTDYESVNPLRLTTGAVAGVSLALLLAAFAFALQEAPSGRREPRPEEQEKVREPDRVKDDRDDPVEERQ